MKRRGLLRLGGLSLAGMGLSSLPEVGGVLARDIGSQQSGKSKARACILLWLEGGPSQIDTWDPKEQSGFRPIPTNVDGIRISELFPRIAHHMEKLSIIRSMHTPENNHPQATYYAMTGHRPNPAMQFPSLGSIITKELGSQNNIPPYVLIPKPWEADFDLSYAQSFNAAFLGPGCNPLILPDPNQANFEIPDLTIPRALSLQDIKDRRAFLRIVDRHYRSKQPGIQFSKMEGFLDRAIDMIVSPNVQRAFDLSRESEKTRNDYGYTRVGQSVLLARRLIEAGCRFALVSGYQHGEWDTHGMTEVDRLPNDQTLRDCLAPTLDQTLSALLEDLDQRGLLESTVVVVTGEFGRTPYLNTFEGRDHWPAVWSLMLGGGGIRGGQIIGSSDKRGGHIDDRMITMGDVFATIYQLLGIDWRKTHMSPSGRPVFIANSIGDQAGRPIDELV